MKSYMKNQVWTPLNYVLGTENYLVFTKIFNSEHLHYLFKLIPSRSCGYVTRNMHKIPLFKTRHTFFKKLFLCFFPSTIIRGEYTRSQHIKFQQLQYFQENILTFSRSSANSFFNSHDIKAIKLIAKLQLGLSHSREHKFNHSFQDSLNPFCN